MISQSMPIAVLYRAIASHELFNPLVLGFWMHLLTGLFCMSLAVRVIENRFRVTTQGDQPVGTNLVERPRSRGGQRISIRCSDRPIFWKDTRLADRTGTWRSVWNVAGFLLTGAVIALSYTMEPVLKTMLGGAAFCIFVCMVVFRFDGLITAEFRDRTWTSLMILPIGYRTILRDKLAAAFRARSAMLFPAGAATVIAGSMSPFTMFMMAIILSLAGFLLAEVSVLNQLTPKSGIGALTGVLLLIMVPADVVLWQLLPMAVSFGITIATLLSLIAALYYVVDRNVERWSDTN
jgi:hypothetical protein